MITTASDLKYANTHITSCSLAVTFVLFSLCTDAVLRPVRIDVGSCQEVYHQDGDCKLPVLSDDTCARRCVPRSYERLPVINRREPSTVMSVKNCYPVRHHCIEGCERKPNITYLFPNSKYQARVDVGKCAGNCVSEYSTSVTECVPVRNKTITVEGPNGFEAVETIEECGCRNTTCYRIDHFQSFSERKMDPNNTTFMREELTVNVGQCIGSCEGVQSPDSCFPSPEDCQFRFGERESYCVPLGGQLHTFTDLYGETQSVASITDCGCSTG